MSPLTFNLQPPPSAATPPLPPNPPPPGASCFEITAAVLGFASCAVSKHPGHTHALGGGSGVGWGELLAVPCAAFNFQMIHQTPCIHEPGFHQCRTSSVCGRARLQALICRLPPLLNKRRTNYGERAPGNASRRRRRRH